MTPQETIECLEFIKKHTTLDNIYPLEEAINYIKQFIELTAPWESESSTCESHDLI